MAYNYEYPYVGTERYNNDWMLKKIHELIAEWKSMQKNFDSLEKEVSALKDWLDNLNLQDEVNKKIDEMIKDGSLLDLLSGSLIPYVMPEWYGAVGNGVVDDTTAIQTALNSGKIVILSNKTYLISKPLLVNTSIYGSGVETCQLTTNSTIDTMLELGNVTDLVIKHFTLNSGNHCNYGIKFSGNSSRSTFEDLKISYTKISGIYSTLKMWLTEFRKVNIYYSGTAFNLVDGEKTSLLFNQCYVINSRIAYCLTADYSVLNNCCADSITDTIFSLSSFNGTLISCATESVGYNSFINAYYSRVECLQMRAFTGKSLITTQASTINMSGSVYNPVDMQLITFSGNSNVLNIKLTNSIDEFTIVDNIEPSTSFSYNGVEMSRGTYLPYVGFDMKNTSNLFRNAIFFNNTIAPFITQSSSQVGSWNPRANMGDVFLSQTPSKSHCAGWICSFDGSRNYYSIGYITTIGTNSIILSNAQLESNFDLDYYENLPLLCNGKPIGTFNYRTGNEIYIKNLQTANVVVGEKIYTDIVTNNTNIKYIPIPLVQVFSSLPTNPYAGLSGYYSAIGKPVWYTGNRWITADGATVT